MLRRDTRGEISNQANVCVWGELAGSGEGNTGSRRPKLELEPGCCRRAHLTIQSVISEDDSRRLETPTSGLFPHPNPSDAGGDASAVCRFSAPVDVSNERSHPSSSPSIKRLLPRQSFTRRLISVKSMRLLVPALWLQTPTSLSGAAHGSAPLPLPLLLFLPFSPFMFPFSSLPRRLGVFVFAPLSFKSRQVGANSLAVFPLLFSLFTFLFSVCGCSLYFPHSFYFSPNWVERKPWSTILKEWSRLWCVSFFFLVPANREPCRFGWLQISSTKTEIKIYTLY